MMEVKIVRIVCPQCGTAQTAKIELEYWMPWASYVHTCEKCGHIITESEWDEEEVKK
jgi:uncharacterized Zn finger protein